MTCGLSSAQHRGTVTVLVLLAMLWLVQAMYHWLLAHLDTSGSFSATVNQTASVFCLATFQLPCPQPVAGLSTWYCGTSHNWPGHIDPTCPDPSVESSCPSVEHDLHFLDPGWLGLVPWLSCTCCRMALMMICSMTFPSTRSDSPVVPRIILLYMESYLLISSQLGPPRTAGK